jgi:signal transduction histidine kinase
MGIDAIGSEPVGRQVVLLAPTGRDAQASRAILDAAGIACTLCHDLSDLCEYVKTGPAAVILPEEVVLADTTEILARALRCQPVWSDLPVIVLSRAGVESPAVVRAMATLGNVSLIERPVRVSTLLSVVRTALRARERQYQARDHMAEQKHAAEERERLLASEQAARAEADAANRAKDQFLAVLSHELRTPLSPVLMALSDMEVDPALSADVRRDVEMIRRNIDLEVRLIDDLLDLSRVRNGKLRMYPQATGVHRLLREVEAICASDPTNQQIPVEFSLAAPDDAVSGDPARLQQLFWNLLKNALKFSNPGGVVRVHTSNPTADSIEIRVTDEGQGIPPELLPKLFDAFEQGPAATKRQFGGLGLGLAIAKAVVELHGGSIRAESEGVGRGARFVVRLPLSHAPEAAPSPPSVKPTANGRLRLLVVEDHPDTARMLGRLLRSSGYDVETAGSVAAALQLVEARPFDLVVSDIGLPDATGHDLMRQVRDRHGLKGIAMTGYGMDEDIRKSLDAGFTDHIVKPVDVAQLDAVIRRVAQAQ